MYPLVPWIGVMAVGYSFGSLFKRESSLRKPLFIKIGLGGLALFLILRLSNSYGDPFPWHEHSIWWKNLLAIIKVHKYPPSLLYVLLTLSISIILLAVLDKVRNKFSDVLSVYGKVPMFYYILHLYLIHSFQLLVALLLGYPLQSLLGNFFAKIPPTWGYSLPIVYLIWLGIIVVLYFPCRWFVKVKQRRSDWWLSYV
jgi:uncharacterized membrane protein